MKFIWALLAVFTVAAAVPSLDESKIVGGVDTDISEVPWQLSLLYASSPIYVPQHICGASIIDRKWALSAAHCLITKNPSNFWLRSGSSKRGSGGTEHEVEKIFEHPQWNNQTKDCDFVLFKVKTPFKTTDPREQSIQMASEEPNEGADALVSGWGLLTENGESPIQLQSVHLPIMSRANCRNIYGSRINDNMICAGDVKGGHDSCQGDSGGPLMVMEKNRPVLAGVVSFGAGCARPKVVGVYANVLAQRKWIEGIIRSNS